MATGIGTGATVSFSSGSSYSGQVLIFNVDGEEVPVIDMAHLGSTGYREKVFGSLVEPPAITVQINFNAGTPPPVGVAATITIAWPGGGGLTGTGAFVSRSIETPLEDKMSGSFVFQMDGQTGPTYS